MKNELMCFFCFFKYFLGSFNRIKVEICQWILFSCFFLKIIYWFVYLFIYLFIYLLLLLLLLLMNQSGAKHAGFHSGNLVAVVRISGFGFGGRVRMRVEGQRIGESASGGCVGVNGVMMVMARCGCTEKRIGFRHGRRPGVDRSGASDYFRFGRTVPLRMRHGHSGRSGSGGVALELMEGCGWILMDRSWRISVVVERIGILLPSAGSGHRMRLEGGRQGTDLIRRCWRRSSGRYSGRVDRRCGWKCRSG